MKIITFCSFKGGTAKTSTALHLGACLARNHNCKVLLIDLDPQANLSIGLGIGPDHLDTMEPVLKEKKSIKDVIRQTVITGMDIVPSNAYLDGIERSAEFINDPYAHERVRKALELVKQDYDYCFIDTPPSLGWLTQSAFLASSYSMICAVPEAYSVLALSRLKEFQLTINKHHRIDVLGVVLSFWDSRGAVNNEFLEQIDMTFSNMLFDSKIRRDVAVSRAVLEGVPVTEYEPSSRASIDYQELAQEFLKRISIGYSQKMIQESANV